AGIPCRYPSSWSPAQCRALEQFRLFICLSLVLLWSFFLVIVPSIPTNWPFGLVSLVSLLLLSQAWVALLTPRDWRRLGAHPGSFWLLSAFLVLWWAVALSATGWIFAQASAPP